MLVAHFYRACAGFQGLERGAPRSSSALWIAYSLFWELMCMLVLWTLT